MSTNTERVRLFLDSELSEHEHGLRRVMRPAAKHPDNPLIVADRPWESPSGPSLDGTVLPYGPGGPLALVAPGPEGPRGPTAVGARRAYGRGVASG